MPEFEELDRLTTADGGKVFKKFIYRRPAFDVVHQILNWHASISKAGRSAHTLRIDPKDLVKECFFLRCHIFKLARTDLLIWEDFSLSQPGK